VVGGGGVLLIQVGQACGVVEFGEPGVVIVHRPRGQVH